MMPKAEATESDGDERAAAYVGVSGIIPIRIPSVWIPIRVAVTGIINSVAVTVMMMTVPVSIAGVVNTMMMRGAVVASGIGLGDKN